MSVQEKPKLTRHNPEATRDNPHATHIEADLDAAWAEVFGAHKKKARRRVAVVPNGPPADELAAYLDDLARQDKAAATVDGYGKDLAHFRAWLEETTGEPFSARAITSTDILAYKTHLRVACKRAPATVNRRLAAIKSFMRWAIAEGHATHDPTARVKAVPAVQQQPHSLSPHELRRLLRAVEQGGKARDWLIVCLGLHAGLRVSEMVNLTLSDVRVSERKGSLYVRMGKGGKDRTIPLNRDLRAALVDYLAVRPKSPDEHLLLGHHGSGLTDDGIQFALRGYGRLAGIDHMHPHRLRHCFATTLARKGIPLPAIQRLLGHTSLLTTQRYMVATEADMTGAVDALATDD